MTDSIDQPVDYWTDERYSKLINASYLDLNNGRDFIFGLTWLFLLKLVEKDNSDLATKSLDDFWSILEQK